MLHLCCLFTRNPQFLGSRHSSVVICKNIIWQILTFYSAEKHAAVFFHTCCTVSCMILFHCRLSQEYRKSDRLFFFQPQVMFSNLGPVQKMDVSQCEENSLVSTSFSTGVRQGNSVFQDQSTTRSINQNNVVSSIFSVCFAALSLPHPFFSCWCLWEPKAKC